MPVSIGMRRTAADLVGLLLDCHRRIRRFVRLAEEIGRRSDLAPADVVEACRQCERYFREALPRHVEDEEQTLFPRLRGLTRPVDDALELMRAQHEEHEQALALLLDALDRVAREPSDASGRAALAAAASPLARAFEEHLALEERVIFPAVQELLPAEARAAALDELRARRAAPSPAPR